jgi:O-methyltransferase
MQKLAEKIKRALKPSAKKERGMTDVPEVDREIIEAAKPFTMTGRERLYALIQAVRYVAEHRIEGDIVECGVWKGGSMMAAAKALAHCGDTSRALWLYDTFEGMPEPTAADVSRKGENAREAFAQAKTGAGGSDWCRSPLDEVQSVLRQSKYPAQRIRFVKGKVEETIPGEAPERIAVLRLDTDWYSSTKHELTHLYPRLAKGGVLLLDDYGYWEGSRKAVDEYLAEHRIPLLLNRIDGSGRIAVKPF